MSRNKREGKYYGKTKYAPFPKIDTEYVARHRRATPQSTNLKRWGKLNRAWRRYLLA